MLGEGHAPAESGLQPVVGGDDLASVEDRDRLERLADLELATDGDRQGQQLPVMVVVSDEEGRFILVDAIRSAPSV